MGHTSKWLLLLVEAATASCFWLHLLHERHVHRRQQLAADAIRPCEVAYHLTCLSSDPEMGELEVGKVYSRQVELKINKHGERLLTTTTDAGLQWERTIGSYVEHVLKRRRHVYRVVVSGLVRMEVCQPSPSAPCCRRECCHYLSWLL